ncbi:HlyD family efflux transporter periplasmic adaptor subunit [Bacillus sp. MUM 13]|uniref:HlyD family efflux transporter periplasmic adaptor subunit n=1 Tax=Bacillus sp. MUM 13 TaxID=1678001 RepID=UPI0008F5CBAA|nr:HlyD family efflux transporter periplasmic adaptor subunit [Bacillus sp. MUM 13]OIK11583.1 transporter [Bacillus sp. MUM 13]
MGRGRLVLVNIVGIIIIFALVAGGAYYYYQSTNFVKTDEAKVAGDLNTIVAPTAGKLKGWNLQEGDNVSKGNTLGKISDGKHSVTVSSAQDGTVVKKQVSSDQLVQAGQVLAQTIDMSKIYITANIKETELSDIEKGDSVDITVDGDPGTTFEGTLEDIGYATNSVFSIMPAQNSSGNYTKVTQKVPVKISIKAPSDKVLPGMNAEVKISTK